jgi:hypothetical protein
MTSASRNTEKDAKNHVAELCCYPHVTCQNMSSFSNAYLDRRWLDHLVKVKITLEMPLRWMQLHTWSTRSRTLCATITINLVSTCWRTRACCRLSLVTISGWRGLLQDSSIPADTSRTSLTFARMQGFDQTCNRASTLI